MKHLANRSLNYTLGFIFFVLILLAAQWFRLAGNNQMPFIEASEYVDTMTGAGVVRWLSADKVIYGANSTGLKNPYRGVDDPDLQSSKNVNILDISTGRTSLYRKGQLIEYKNGKILIRLTLSEYDHDTNRDISPAKLLYGNFGSENQKEYEQAYEKPFLYLPPLDKCPSDSTNGENYGAWLLRPENACLRIPNEFGKDRRWIYYQASGQAFELTTSEGTFTPDFKWVDWIGAYVIENRFPSVEATAQVRVLYPNGKFELIHISHAAAHAKPTKVGVIGALNNKGATDGLRLFNEGAARQLTRGYVSLTEVSPDGCKVAYVTNVKLRVIDLCSL